MGVKRRGHSRALFAAAIATMLLALTLGAACTPQSHSSESESAQSSPEANVAEATQESASKSAEAALVQEAMADFTQSDTGLFPENVWNSIYLNAGNRGCNSCHASLETVIQNSGVKDHPVPKSGYANNRDVTILDGCLSCHAVHSADYGNYFADAIHSAHYSNATFTDDLHGNCWNCHAIKDTTDMTDLGNTDWVLWEQIKYDGALGGFPDSSTNALTREFLKLNGHESGYVTDVAATEEPEINVELSQDLSDMNDAYVALNHPTHTKDELYDKSHTFTVTGVNNPREFSYDDLLAMPQTTKRATAQCAVAGSAGHNIYNAEYTGVLVSDIIDACGGLVEGNNQAFVTGWDEWECAQVNNPITSYVPDALVALKVNGEDLPYEYGGPMCLIMPGTHSGPWCKFLKSIEFSKGEPYDLLGFLYQSVPGDVLPAVSAAWFENDGLEVTLGEEVNLTGYGYALAKSVAPLDRIEFSCDLGATWVPVDVPDDFDPNQWVTFKFSWTPDTAGTHIIKVRGVNTDGYLSNIDGSIIVNVVEA